MMRYDVIVIGGGAAGLTAAISAKRRGASVLVCERMSGPGKKILATGGGRCNLLNEKLDASFYNPEARNLVGGIFEKFGRDAILKFFGEIGLAVHTDEGRIYPATLQAASVLRVLELELSRLSVPCEYGCQVAAVQSAPEGLILKSKDGKTFTCGKAVLAGGGKSYPALGSDGNALELAAWLGHRLIEPVPSAVPLAVRDHWCHLLQGQRIRARVAAIISGKMARKAAGEILFTKYGVSGTAVLDVSEDISIALHRRHVKDVEVSVDLVPWMDAGPLEEELERRRARGFGPGDLLAGLLPPKFSQALSDILKKHDIPALVTVLKDKRFPVAGTRGWNEAEFTAGGIDTAEVRPTLESKILPGLYLAGEILDVQGPRGGYNLAWAWASGFVAGMGE